MDEDEIQKCYDCICRGAVHCGITYKFWKDSGVVSEGTKNQYNVCMLSADCARKTMSKYYKIFKKVKYFYIQFIF